MRRPRIAVVDDDAAYRKLMTIVLEDEGYQPVLHDRAEGAASLIHDEQPDAVIVDMRMEHPDSGLQVVQQLQQDPTTDKIPIIVCSAEPDVSDTVAQLRLAHCHVLRKPVHLSLLITKIRQLVARCYDTGHSAPVHRPARSKPADA